MKTLTIRQMAQVKRVAQNVNPLVVKKNKIAAKIDELNAEYNALTEEIEGHEMGVKKQTGGYTSEDLVIKRIEETGKMDKNGNPIKVTKYEPNFDMVTFNEESNVYEIKEEEVISEGVNTEDVDDSEKAPEVEVKAGDKSPIDPLNPFGEQDNNIPYAE